MVKWLKPGRAAEQKIKSSARAVAACLVLAAWAFSILACSRSVVQPKDLTATAVAAQANPTSPVVTQVASSSHSSQPRPAEMPVEATPTRPPSATPEPTQVPTIEASPTEAPATEVPATEVPVTPLPVAQTTENPILYYTQAGDTLDALAARFGVSAQDITFPNSPPTYALLDPNILLIIPNVLQETGSSGALLPDSEIVFSPSAADFNIYTFVSEAGGYLKDYREWGVNGWDTGADVVERVAIENSINPRILLALLEYQGHWVYGQPTTLREKDYPIGWAELSYSGLYKQLSWAVQQLSIGYYGWRAGLLTELTFPNQGRSTTTRLSPELNAGSVALQYLFSKLYDPREWGGALYAPEGLPTLYEQMFGNPWLRAQAVEPLYPTTLTQPTMELPFVPGHTWSFTGGPHSAWGPDGALASLDFAPASNQPGCAESLEWVTAVASGLVVRSENGVVVVDLDGDGHEQTGWDVMYLHVATKDRVAVNTVVNTGDIIGHPSCEGGSATGTHVHVARKYNGEWILADGPLPFVLSGWRAHAGTKPYEGSLTKDDEVVTACDCGSYETRITRPLTPSP